MTKRLAALFLVLLLSIESFGAVVSDNDGSAFITKAEFDSLKNNFQSQIDQYNTSIDSKIDGAIASYLSGIKTDKITRVTSLLYNINNFKTVYWTKDWVVPTTQLGDKCDVNTFSWFAMSQNLYWPGAPYSPGCGTYTHALYSYLESQTGDAKPTWKEIGDTETIIGQATKNEQYNKFYFDENSFYKIKPWALGIIAFWHSSMNCVVSTNNFKDPYLNFTNATDMTNENAEYGKKSYLWNLEFVYGTSGEKANMGNINASYVTGTTDTNLALTAVTNGKNIIRLSGGSVSGKIYGTTKSEWNITADNASNFANFSTGKGFKYCTFKNSDLNTPGTHDEALNYYPFGLGKVNVYNKKNKEYNASDLILNDWTNVSGKEISYFSGAPLLSSSSNGVAKLDLRFTVDGTSGGATFAIKNTKFNNSNDFGTDLIDLYNDVELNNKVTDLSFTGTIYEKTFYFEVENNKVYWIKVKPTNENDVSVTTKEDVIEVIES